MVYPSMSAEFWRIIGRELKKIPVKFTPQKSKSNCFAKPELLLSITVEIVIHYNGGHLLSVVS